MLSAVLAGALSDTCKPLRGASDGRELAMVKVANFDAIRKKHAVTQPIEPIRQDDLALCSGGYTIKINRGRDLVAVT